MWNPYKEPAIAQCQCCGHSDALLSVIIVQEKHYVNCGSCGNISNGSRSRIEAIYDWNGISARDREVYTVKA